MIDPDEEGATQAVVRGQGSGPFPFNSANYHTPFPQTAKLYTAKLAHPNNFRVNKLKKNKLFTSNV